MKIKINEIIKIDYPIKLMALDHYGTDVNPNNLIIIDSIDFKNHELTCSNDDNGFKSVFSIKFNPKTGELDGKWIKIISSTGGEIYKIIKYQTLTYHGNFVDMNRLFDGIYSTNVPSLYESFDVDERIEFVKDQFGAEQKDVKDYIENIKQCNITEMEVKILK